MSHTTKPTKYTCHYRPRHPLAQYIITQIDTLALRPQHIIKAMGYAVKHTLPACERLRHVLSNRYLGLDGSYIDRCFTADEFLFRLFAVLNLSYEPFVEDIAQIKAELAHYPYPVPKYYLQAKVDFDFEDTHWRARSGASCLANVHLPAGFAALTDTERAAIVKDHICEHYQQYEGSLPYDGVIKGYHLHTEQNNEVIDSIEYGLPKSSSV